MCRRDFDTAQRCLADTVQCRALLPMGAFEFTGAAAVADRFRTWFGGDDAFEVLEASTAEVGEKQYLRWRVRMTSAAPTSRIAEQHLFVTGTDAVETIDLLCSGFQSADAAVG